jgi:iron complex transport system permease protein
MRAKVEEARLALLWLTGSLSSTPWWQVVVSIVIIALLPALVVASRWLPLVQLGRRARTGSASPARRFVWSS